MATSATTPARTATSPHPGSSTRPWLALTLLCLAQLMLVLDITVVNVALPAIGHGLSLGRSDLTWVLTAYTLAFGGLMLLGGRLADQFGARRMLLTGLAVFTAASAVSGLAGTGAVLIAGRVAQGVGAALLSPAALALVTTMFDGPRRARALGIWAAVGGSGAAIGVAAGGLITSEAGWRWVFFINLPIGLAVLAAVPVLIAARPQPARRPLDLPGALIVVAATGAAIYGLISAGSDGWLTARALGPIAAAVAGYLLFGLRERTAAAPLMQVRLLATRSVGTGAFLMLVATALLVGGFFLGSFYLQQVRGYSAVHTGLTFLPLAVAIILGAQASGHLATVLDRRALTAGALALAAVGETVAALWHGPVPLITGLSVASIGIGAALVAASTTALADTPPAEAGLRSGVINTFHELGSALGVAVLSSLAAPSLTGISLTGFTRAFTACAVAALAAALVAIVLAPPGRAAASAGPHGH
jgi:EmrB/QacA subfamily drug resistance transporter